MMLARLRLAKCGPGARFDEETDIARNTVDLRSECVKDLELLRFIEIGSNYRGFALDDLVLYLICSHYTG